MARESDSPWPSPWKTHMTNSKAGEVHGRQGQKTQAGGSHPPSLCRWVGQIGQNLGLVDGIEQVLGIHGQGV